MLSMTPLPRDEVRFKRILVLICYNAPYAGKSLFWQTLPKKDSTHIKNQI